MKIQQVHFERKTPSNTYLLPYFSSSKCISKINIEKLRLLVNSGLFKPKELSEIFEMKGRRIDRVLRGDEVLTNAEILRLTEKTKITLDWLQAPLEQCEHIPAMFCQRETKKRIIETNPFAVTDTLSDNLNELKKILEATGISLETISKSVMMSKSMFIKKINGEYEFYAEELFILIQLCKRDLFSLLDEEGVLQNAGKRYFNFDMPVLTRFEGQKRLAENLKIIRKKKGMDIEDAAKKLYIDADHLSQIEDRKKKVRVSLLMDIAKLYETAPEKFFLNPSEFYIK